MFIMSPPTSLLTYLQKWRQVLLNGVDGQSVVVRTYRISLIVVKQTSSNWGTFNMFNIIETLLLSFVALTNIVFMGTC